MKNSIIKEYKISKKQWVKPLIKTSILLTIGGIIILLSMYDWNKYNIIMCSILIIFMLSVYTIIVTQINWIISLNFNTEYIIIKKRLFFRIKIKKYEIDKIKCSYKKIFYGRSGKIPCFIVEEKYQRKEIIPAYLVGENLLNDFMKDLENSGIFIEKIRIKEMANGTFLF